MEINVESIKALREKTSAGIMDCKRALEEAEGDLSKAQEILNATGMALAAKKATRETNEGIIESYLHSGGRIGAMVEVNCETDFVARTPDFRELAHELAMQVAAMSPNYVDASDVPDAEEVIPQEACLMQQPSIRDPGRSVHDMVAEAVGKLGENVRVRRFARFSLGG